MATWRDHGSSVLGGNQRNQNEGSQLGTMDNGSAICWHNQISESSLLSVKKCIFIKEKIVILHFKSYKPRTVD